MWLLLAIALARAEDVDETVVVEGGTIAEAREAVAVALEAEGYHRAKNKGDRTVFLADQAWKSRVVLYDEGYVQFEDQPIRLHPPGQQFADEGHRAGWLLCAIRPGACVDLGTRAARATDPRVVQGQRSRVAVSIDPELRVLQGRIVADRMKHRLEVEIPEQCAEIWARDLPAAERRRLLFVFWDSRTETVEGEAARDAIRAFLAGVVQASDAPYTEAEIAGYNADRHVTAAFAP